MSDWIAHDTDLGDDQKWPPPFKLFARGDKGRPVEEDRQNTYTAFLQSFIVGGGKLNGTVTLQDRIIQELEAPSGETFLIQVWREGGFAAYTRSTDKDLLELGK